MLLASQPFSILLTGHHIGNPSSKSRILWRPPKKYPPLTRIKKVEIRIHNERELLEWEARIGAVLARYDLDYVLGGIRQSLNKLEPFTAVGITQGGRAFCANNRHANERAKNRSVSGQRG